MSIQIDYEKCCWKNGSCQNCSCGSGCVGCVEVCPVQAISRGDKVEIDESMCLNCGVCVSACKHGALKLI
jgi:Fe-S-cluster-containing hydrogenase component 2